MSVLDLMKKRCSVRKFEDKPVEKEKMLTVLEAARIAPSACNNQPWHFVVVQEESLRLRISERWGKVVPAIIVVCGDHEQAWHRGSDGKDHTDVDASIAIDHMTLMAAELGLGTCWVCSFSPEDSRDALGLPDHIEPIALLPIGYPAEMKLSDRHDEDRKPIEEIVSWDDYRAES